MQFAYNIMGETTTCVFLYQISCYHGCWNWPICCLDCFKWQVHFSWGRELAMWSVALWSATNGVRFLVVAVDFYLQRELVFWLFDGVPLTPMSSHCWHVKEPYHSARVQVMGSGRPTPRQERRQYVCAFWVACL